MKSKHIALSALLLFAIPFSISVVSVEPDYWPVSEGEVLCYKVFDDFSEAYGEINLTIDMIHENGIIDFHTTVVGTPEMSTLLGGGSTSNNLTLLFDEIVFLYSSEELSVIDWKKEFTDVKEVWEAQSNFFTFWGKIYTYNRYKYMITRKIDNERYQNFEIEYSEDGILNRYVYGEIGSYIEEWDSYKYNSVEWVRDIDRSIPVVGYIVFSVTMLGLGALAVQIGWMWKKEEKTR